ncbi:MAG: RpiB/LacA/LacB family sugar-phosphate isomerase [Patescibacteria group bacterium]
MIYISSDHRGLDLKNYLFNDLLSKGFEITDLGPKTIDPSDDYPDYASIVAKRVQKDDVGKGILICANGVGVSITANKFNGIRATLSWTPQHAESSRRDDNSNILALPSDYISKEQALETTLAWLNTPFSNEERYQRRINKIRNIENES